MSSYAESILNRLHDLYLKGIDCDVILRAADYLGESGAIDPDSSTGDLVWTELHCHKIVLRAASSFFDRILSRPMTSGELCLDDDVKGVIARTQTGESTMLKITLNDISSQSLQTLVNFAYTGIVQIDTNLMKKTIQDLKLLNVRHIIDILEMRIEEETTFANCIPNLILSSGLERDEIYSKILLFILEEFHCGLRGKGEEKIFDHHLLLTKPEMVESIEKDLQQELQTLSIPEDKVLLNILLKLLKFECVSEEEESKLTTFLASKKRGKCRVHLEPVIMHCYTDGEDLCVKCLIDGHVRHHIEPLGTAKHRVLTPAWGRVDVELDDLKSSAKSRITELKELATIFGDEQSRDFAVLRSCAEIKPRMDTLAKMFASGELDAADNDVLAFERFVDSLQKECKRTQNDFERAKRISEELLSIMEKRCASCASIADAAFEIQTHEDMDEIDLEQPLQINNCIFILKRAKLLGNQNLYDGAFDFILGNFMKVVNDSGDSFYRRISHSVLECFLKSDKLNIESEDQVLLVVEKWLQFDYGLRKKFAVQLLSHVRFGDISEEILQQIKANPLHIVMRNEDCKKLLKGVESNPRESMIKKVLCLGDNGQNLILTSVNGTWEEWQGQNNGTLFSTVKIKSKVYFIGGVKNAGQYLNTVSIYNLKTKVWTNGPCMREARYLFGTCVSSTNVIYVMGGCNPQTSNVEMLQCDCNGDPIGGWQSLPPMNTARSHFEAACVDDKIYAIGGAHNIATVEVFDPKVNSWRYCKSMAQGKDCHTISTYKGEIYVFGYNGFCEKYNPTTDTWTPIARLSAKGSLRGSVVLNDKIYVIDGAGCSEVDVYDTKTNNWSKGPQMPKEIGYTKCVAV